jgi:GT2 family glycosyltransferase
MRPVRNPHLNEDAESQRQSPSSLEHGASPVAVPPTPPPQVGELVQALEAQAARIRELEASNVALGQQLDQLSRTHAATLATLSWRLTAPLRTLRDALAHVGRVFRWRLHHMRLEPLRDLVMEGEAYRSTGYDPQFLLHTPRWSRPTAWTLVSYEAASRGAWLSPKLYVDSGTGFSEHETFALPARVEGRAECLICLPRRVRALRLDPLAAPGRFEFRNVTFREIGTVQAAAILAARHLPPLIRHPRHALRLAWRGLAIVRSEGLRALKHRLVAWDQSTASYAQWITSFDTLGEADRAAIRRHIARLSVAPRIAVLMRTHNTPEKLLRSALDSVRTQLYPHWELRIAVDASTVPHVRRVLDAYQADDARITAVYGEEPADTADLINGALAGACAEWTTLLAATDELAEHALYLVAVELNASPTADLVYSDEDRIDERGQRHDPYFKPDWNLDLFRSQNLPTRLCVVRTSVVRDVGGMREACAGAEDWDLVLRVAERIPAANIRHVPHVLYHGRALAGAPARTGNGTAQSHDTRLRILASHFNRLGQRVDIQPVADLGWRIKYPLPAPAPLVTIIIPTRDRLPLLERCVESVFTKTRYPHFELIIVDNQSEDPRTAHYLHELASRRGVRVLRYDAPFNFSAINNLGASHARGEVLALINNDIEVISPDWLEELVSQAWRPEIGAVGAMLYYPDDTIQHAGVILGLGSTGIAAHPYSRRPRGHAGQMGRALLTQDVSAVTGACLVLRREVFEAVGGFDEAHLPIAYNDVDLCLRIRARGYRILWTPHAELYHHESASRGYENGPIALARFRKEIEYMMRPWAQALRHDPAYNPNLALGTEAFALGFPPRTRKPWCDDDEGRAS